MKICKSCETFFQEHVMACQHCGGPLEEISLSRALALTEEKSLHNQISGKHREDMTDERTTYHIRSYMGNRSLFLDFDIQKYRMKHGRRLKRFLICPIRVTAVLNLPWLLFNVISSNLFHMQYTVYCPRCHCKCTPRHTTAECDYHIEYFQILDDVLSGRISRRKDVYRHYARERKAKGLPSAYHDLFERPARVEAFWDIVSISFSVFLWLYLAVFVSLPMSKVLVQKLRQINAYQWGIELR